MFSGRISEAVARQIEKKIAENNDLNSLSNSELANLAVEFVGDAPPSHVPRETVIEILSQQPQISEWRTSIKQKAITAAKEKVSTMAANVDPRMADMIKQQFGQWLQNSGLSSTEITTKIDTNSDGKITEEELNRFIQNLSGTNPPDWVSVTLMSILDTDQNGVIEVQELWNYLGAIGFNVPSINHPEDQFDQQQELNESQINEEQANDEAEIDIDSELAELDETEPTIEPDQVSNPSIEPVVESPDAILQTTQEQNHDESISTVNTSIEIGIEKLHSTRLHRESNQVIQSTGPGHCQLMVERVERTLMVMDNYRGGMTATGLLDGGPYTVAVLFEPEYNELIEQSVGKKISFTGALYDWSSGLRQAKIKASELES
ncbi:MAG: hypothetical protein CM15mP3_08730 [Candidatus Poseidoniales archaeon]|nr:MAG: hypothetical protein CM15mP3_08730 [Candidatus Poseidoniales archaeon]